MLWLAKAWSLRSCIWRRRGGSDSGPVVVVGNADDEPPQQAAASAGTASDGCKIHVRKDSFSASSSATAAPPAGPLATIERVPMVQAMEADAVVRNHRVPQPPAVI